MAQSVYEATRCMGNCCGVVCRSNRRRSRHTALAVDRADRPAGPLDLFAATIARGRQLAALGDCAICHTDASGIVNAGGRAIETPFGMVYSTNITPDPATGIGTWSYPAFERVMREAIHRDGRQLYPAFPHPHYANVTDADLQALYAYLMVQAPVRA